MELLQRQLLFVTGKGGVGKTSIAAALGHLAAHQGQRTLVCEMDAKGSLAASFDCAPFDYAPRQIDRNLFGMAMNTEDSLREYLRLFVRLPFIGRIGPLAHTFDFVADAAPGVKEILAIGKLCWEVRQRNYDLVIVDAEATGHIVSQIGAPRVIRELVQVGPVNDQTAWMLEILDDPQRTGLIAVTTPEEMPVNETIELLAKVRTETKVDVASVIVNRMPPASFSGPDAQIVAGLLGDESRALLVAALGPAVDAVLDGVRLGEGRRSVAERHVSALEAAIGTVPMTVAPELFTRATGRRVVALLAESLGSGPR